MSRAGYAPEGAVVQVAATGEGGVLAAQKGVCSDPAGGPCQKVFIAWNERYLGTDTREPSRAILGVGPAGTGRIAVTYAAYAPGDDPCCPSLAPVTVIFTCNASRCVWSQTPPGHSPLG